MNKFTFTTAEDVAVAIHETVDHPGSKFIAGGTNLLDLMKENVERPDHLIDINHLPFNQIEELPDGSLRLGALATNADTAWHPLVESRYPLLSKATLAGASAQLRNMATNGGNLFQRTRCYYFYDTATPCNKREPGSGCSAINGFNRIHAILGQSEHCIATHPSDMAIALAALDARVNIKGKDGDRSIAFTDFHRLPGDEPWKDNNLQPGDFVTSIDLPAQGFAANHTYTKIRDRASYAFALVSVAVGLEMEGNIMKQIRIALGGVAHKPWRDFEAEQQFQNLPANAESFEYIADFIIRNAKGYGDNSFKIKLAKQAIIRSLNEASGMEGQQ